MRSARRGNLSGAIFTLIISTAWCGLAAAQPSSLALHSAILDASRQRMVVFGGTPDFNSVENDIWELTLDLDPRWQPLTPSGVGPASRMSHTATYDALRDRMIVFGGRDSLLQVLDDAWSLSLSDHTWSALSVSGTKPQSRWNHSAIYDSARDRIVIFGGDHANQIGLNDVWSLWLSPSPRWERLIPKGVAPLARYGHSASYDPVRDRMIVFGGPALNDMWALSFADTTWSPLFSSGPLPPARYGHSAVYDPPADRLVILGGYDGFQYFDDTWLLSLSSGGWTKLVTDPPAPSGRTNHSAVYDSAYGRLVVFGGTPSATDPTWALSLTGAMRWSPLRPLLETAPSEILLADVTVGDTVSTTFSLSNRGLEPLAIQSFELPSTQLSLSQPAPPELPWNAGITETLQLAAASTGDLRDSIIIVSNDPIEPRRRLPVRALVRGLAFGTRVLGEPDSVPSGQSFIVVITPEAGVTVERGTLYYRVADGGSPFDSLSLTPLATDFIAAIPASAVTEHGVEYYARVENSGYSAVQPATAPTAFYTQDVSSPDAITAVTPRPTSGTDFLEGLGITVDVALPAGAVFQSGTLHARRGGEPSYLDFALLPTGPPGQTSATIPETLVGPRGIEYWVEIQTLQWSRRYPTGGFAVLRTTIPNLVEEFVHPGGRYRLLTVPLDFGADFSGTLDGLLSDQLGTYDPIRWRAFVYDPARSGNVEFSQAEAERFRPRPGRSFWLISRDDHLVDSEPVPGLSTSTNGEYSIALAQGWNMVGNPFAFAVAWADVLRDTGVEDPVAFDSSRGSIGDYSEVTPTVLVPFEGYFVYAAQAATIRVAPRAASIVAVATGARPAASSDDGWSLRLVTLSETAIDRSSVLGVRAVAASGFDASDRRKPPSLPGSWVRAVFPHRDWQERSGEFQTDLRAQTSEGEIWEVEIRSPTAGEPLSIEIDEIAAPPSRFGLRIIDREQETVTDGNPGSPALRIVSFGDRPYRLAIAVGTEEYLASAAALGAPSRVALDSSSPNPFRLATRIRFGLPRASRASLEVYNVLGERVATLIDHGVVEPGFHSALWDGRTNRGRQAPSGVYLIRLQAEEEALTRRVVLVR